jgi:putative membrane protein insertion efficiency factor
MSAVRRATWWLGAPVRAVLLGAIRIYRATLSGWLGGQCRFYPSCSEYAEEAIRVHGAVRGSALVAWRILRCNPFGAGGIEYVPPRSRSRTIAGASDRILKDQVYENVIRLSVERRADPAAAGTRGISRVALEGGRDTR